MRIQISGNLICPSCGKMMLNSIEGKVAKCITDNCTKKDHVFVMPYVDVECLGVSTVEHLWHGCFDENALTTLSGDAIMSSQSHV